MRETFKRNIKLKENSYINELLNLAKIVWASTDEWPVSLAADGYRIVKLKYSKIWPENNKNYLFSLQKYI